MEHVRLESSLSPSTEASSAPTSARWSEKPEKSSSVSTDISQEDRAWSHLSQDLQFYLEYHTTHLNYHHYFFKHDANHFLHNTLVEHALQYDPLLYAVVGFAAFQLSVTRADGKIQDFLGYYNNSVSLLRKSLVENQKHTDATMLTILQLATFEVRWYSCLRVKLTTCKGLPGRLGQLTWPSESSLWNASGTILVPFRYGDRCAEEDSCLVLKI